MDDPDFAARLEESLVEMQAAVLAHGHVTIGDPDVLAYHVCYLKDCDEHPAE